MSEAIPSDILDHAYDLVEAMQSNKMDALTADYNRYSSMLTDDANAIARALMAAAKEADEAATKRERERCAALAFSFVGEAPEDDAPLNVYDEAVNAIATAISATILKGEA